MMTRDRFEDTNWKMSYEEYRACDCTSCDREECKHRNAYRRVPKIDDGLGLCPNLSFVPIIEDHGVIVEYNNKIVDFRTKDHAISSLIDKVNYTREELELKFYNKVYVVL